MDRTPRITQGPHCPRGGARLIGRAIQRDPVDRDRIMAILRAIRVLAYALLAGLVFPPVAQGQWVLDGVPICTAPNVQFTPGVVPDGLGGALIFWVDGRKSRPDLYAQRVTADGRIAP